MFLILLSLFTQAIHSCDLEAFLDDTNDDCWIITMVLPEDDSEEEEESQMDFYFGDAHEDDWIITRYFLEDDSEEEEGLQRAFHLEGLQDASMIGFDNHFRPIIDTDSYCGTEEICDITFCVLQATKGVDWILIQTEFDNTIDIVDEALMFGLDFRLKATTELEICKGNCSSVFYDINHSPDVDWVAINPINTQC